MTTTNQAFYPTHNEQNHLRRSGASKREVFAMHALQGIKANSIIGVHHIPTNAVREAVELADLLIAELNKNEDN